MKILFVFKSFEWLGIEYLSAALKKAGHEVELAFEIGLDGTLYFPKIKSLHRSILEKIESFAPDIILFSCTSNFFPWAKEVARLIKTRFQIPIITGGIHPTINPEQVILEESIDMLCMGEGEEAIVELVGKMDRGGNIFETRNFWFKHNGTVIKNPLRPFIGDLDSLPFPDKRLFYQYRCFSERVYVITSRGCPYRCTYCFNHQLQNLYAQHSGNYVRRRSVNSVMAELRQYMENFGIKSVHFYDDTFTLQKDWLAEFYLRYKKEVGLPFYCITRVDHLDEEDVRMLAEAGCRYLAIGIESGNDFIAREVLKRSISHQQIRKAAELLKKFGIKFLVFNIFGIPRENDRAMIDTMKLNLSIRPDSILSYTFYPFYGTELSRIACEEGLVEQQSLKSMQAGDNNVNSASLLNHPFKHVAYNCKVILALLNRLPDRLHDYFLNKWIFRRHSPLLLELIKIISIPFYSRWEFSARLKEQLAMHRHYFFTRIKKAVRGIGQKVARAPEGRG